MPSIHTDDGEGEEGALRSRGKKRRQRPLSRNGRKIEVRQILDEDTHVKDYGSYSFWLESSVDDLTPRPPLDGSTEVDIAILGAGFTGLWTAYCLLRRDPALNVLVVEREIAGFGASGRNGGWCVADFPVSPAVMT